MSQTSKKQGNKTRSKKKRDIKLMTMRACVFEWKYFGEPNAYI